jgi:hypothetical protein
MIKLKANPVSSFEEGTNEAAILSQVYEPWVKGVLSMHPWSFCSKREQLSRENKTMAGAKYLYKVPAEALRIFAIFDSDDQWAPPLAEFKIFADEAGQYIACAYEQVYASYTFYAQEATWPAWFNEFPVYALASRTAVEVAGDEGMQQNYYAIAFGTPSDNGNGGLFAKAALISDQQQPPQYYGRNAIIAARFS